jgi:hypothetical protein
VLSQLRGGTKALLLLPLRTRSPLGDSGGSTAFKFATGAASSSSSGTIGEYWGFATGDTARGASQLR